jgi:hypothetical protein
MPQRSPEEQNFYSSRLDDVKQALWPLKFYPKYALMIPNFFTVGLASSMRRKAFSRQEPTRPFGA